MLSAILSALHVFSFINSLIHQMFAECSLEARHWNRLWGIVVIETKKVLPSWNFHSSEDSDNRQGNTNILCQMLWRIEPGTYVIPVTYCYNQHLILTHFSILISHDTLTGTMFSSSTELLSGFLCLYTYAYTVPRNKIYYCVFLPFEGSLHPRPY